MRVYVPKSKALTFSNGKWHGGGAQKAPEEVANRGRVKTQCVPRPADLRKGKR